MLIKRLNLKKILSFNDATVDLGQLNVLIGPNAVGKTNLIEVISLLQAAPTSGRLVATILNGGGIRQWLWLGDLAASSPLTTPIATIECDVTLRRGRQVGPLEYQLQFSEDPTGFVILGEQLTKSSRGTGNGRRRPYFTRGSLGATLQKTESVLAKLKNPIDTTPITEVGNHFEEIRIYREFRTGRGSGARSGVPTIVAKDALQDGGDNLALVLQELDFRGRHELVRRYLLRFCERFDDVKIEIANGLARAFLLETGLVEMLSSIRMSDGTLKFLALLAALFHPKPPPLMCIEEPELGLHPDAMQLVAEALIEASQSMQLVVTTHSDALVDALTDRPESVLVCDRDFDKGTQMKRLSKTHLKEWLKHYSLGELWRKGEIGGGRW
jgi:predicted ATPase